ncbi:hypothetical protein [Thiosulfativibrio zosterae]|uniref:DUF4402 domain-containing protein n=1 Tax=Thiosulfativibrio zosterae TaxID=2675053 RepID=A0A6F8PLL1_9GAMM|nr:hypothetical protein [Thiosulfativibrio zosterae]BBP42989.1 hypothetical protein THMIRHAT_07350 [Thiosulfativibrio zosterae]
MQIRIQKVLTSWLLSLSLVVQAGEVSQQQALSFGKIALKNNNTVAIMQITSTGQILKDDAFVVLEAGQPGRFLLYDFPPFTQLSFSISPGSTASSYSGGVTPTQFSIEPYLDFATQNTNAQGELILNLPARLVTSGNGSVYPDGDYYRFFELNIDY